MKLTKEDAQSIVWEENSDWKNVDEKIVDTTRWSVVIEGIFQHLPDKRFYKLIWSQGATEMQDELPFEYEDEVTAIEVIEKEVTVKQWFEV